MRRPRLSLIALLAPRWLAGPLMLVALVSPAAESVTEQNLVAHHLVHWLMVLGGALCGYQVRRFGGRRWIALAAWAGLGAALAWHLPPLLALAEAHRTIHVFAHASLVIGGGAMGWAVPELNGAARAYLFVSANVVMWPLVLAELSGAFSYAGYAGQAPGAGVAELVAMSLSWFVLAFWGPIRRLVSGPGPSAGGLVLLAGAGVLGWTLQL